MEWFSIFQKPYVARLAATLLSVACILGLRHFTVNAIFKRVEVTPTIRRRWIVTTRNAALFFIIAIMFVIWLEQLRTLAATLVVIAAAIVIATKEFLLNIVGFFYQKSFKFINIGDRIEIEGIRGDIIDESLMGVTLMEIGPGDKSHQYTGMTTFIPNSKFLLTPVRNETHLWGDYVFHLITIPIKGDGDWKACETALISAAEQVSAPYIDEASKTMTRTASRHSLEEPTVSPRIHIQVASPDLVNLVLRLPVPAKKRGRVEQEIIRSYLSLIDDSD